MIKINLLNSVTERQGSTVMAVDRKVGSPASRLLLLTLAVGFLLAAVIGWDVISTQMAKADAEGPKRMAPFLRLYLSDNPLSEAARTSQLDAVKAAGVRIDGK